MAVISDSLNSVKTFTNELGDDIALLSREQDTSARDLRVWSVASRILGALCAVTAAALLITGAAALMSGSAIGALVGTITFVFFAVLAHDLLKVGSNIQKMLQVDPKSGAPGENLLQAGWRLASGVFEVGKAAWYEGTTGRSALLRDTIIFEPLSKITNNKPQQDVNKFG